jgi:enolase-phosphatase E1
MPPWNASVSYVLADIEGTTTSVSFVYEVLFPYFSAHFRAYARAHETDPGFQAQIADVQHTVAAETGHAIDAEQAVETLLEWCTTDRKHTALKNLQGDVWRAGYLNGELKGHVYPDVPPALERWKNQGKRMGIYSSGSVDAQKLLFGHSEAGNLLPYFEHHFDTRVGHKREVESYRRIAETLDLSPENILFLSDVEAELDAATDAGFQTIHIVRPGTQSGEKHRTATDFNAL